MSPTGVIFSYAIGLIFAVGGIVFLIGLDDNRFLYGIPYLLIGARHHRRRRREPAEDEAARAGRAGAATTSALPKPLLGNQPGMVGRPASSAAAASISAWGSS